MLNVAPNLSEFIIILVVIAQFDNVSNASGKVIAYKMAEESAAMSNP